MTRMNMIKVAIALAIGSTPFFGCGAYAFEQWSMNGTSCTPDAGSIQNNLYIGTAGTVKFAPGKIGNIVLYCPVPTLSWTPTSIAIQYYDDSAAPGNHVTAPVVGPARTSESTVATLLIRPAPLALPSDISMNWA